MRRIEREPTGEAPMPYAFVLDVAATWAQYERLAAAMSEPAPAGLVLHVAGPTDEGFRTIDVWESKQDWVLFRQSRLEPAIAALAVSLQPRSTFRDLRAANLVTGAALGAAGPGGLRKEER